MGGVCPLQLSHAPPCPVVVVGERTASIRKSDRADRDPVPRGHAPGARAEGVKNEAGGARGHLTYAAGIESAPARPLTGSTASSRPRPEYIGRNGSGGAAAAAWGGRRATYDPDAFARRSSRAAATAASAAEDGVNGALTDTAGARPSRAPSACGVDGVRQVDPVGHRHDDHNRPSEVHGQPREHMRDANADARRRAEYDPDALRRRFEGAREPPSTGIQAGGPHPHVLPHVPRGIAAAPASHEGVAIAPPRAAAEEIQLDAANDNAGDGSRPPPGGWGRGDSTSATPCAHRPGRRPRWRQSLHATYDPHALRMRFRHLRSGAPADGNAGGGVRTATAATTNALETGVDVTTDLHTQQRSLFQKLPATDAVKLKRLVAVPRALEAVARPEPPPLKFHEIAVCVGMDRRGEAQLQLVDMAAGGRFAVGAGAPLLRKVLTLRGWDGGRVQMEARHYLLHLGVQAPPDPVGGGLGWFEAVKPEILGAAAQRRGWILSVGPGFTRPTAFDDDGIACAESGDSGGEDPEVNTLPPRRLETVEDRKNLLAELKTWMKYAQCDSHHTLTLVGTHQTGRRVAVDMSKRFAQGPQVVYVIHMEDVGKWYVGLSSRPGARQYEHAYIRRGHRRLTRGRRMHIVFVFDSGDSGKDDAMMRFMEKMLFEKLGMVRALDNIPYPARRKSAHGMGLNSLQEAVIRKGADEFARYVRDGGDPEFFGPIKIPALPDDIMPCGQHRGLRYSDVLRHHREYAVKLLHRAAQGTVYPKLRAAAAVFRVVEGPGLWGMGRGDEGG